MASSSYHPLLLLLFLLVAVLPHISCDIDSLSQVLKCESSVVNGEDNVISEVKTAIAYLVRMGAPTSEIRVKTVYGLSWCRPDFSRSACSSCLSIAAQKIQNDCGSNVVAARFLSHDFCYLRVDKKNFIGQLDTLFCKVRFDTDTPVIIAEAHQAAYWDSVNGLLTRVKRQILRKKTMFVEMDTNFSLEKLKIFGKAMCSRDLDMKLCRHCLDEAMIFMKIRCGNRTYCEVIYGSCFLTYRTKAI